MPIHNDKLVTSYSSNVQLWGRRGPPVRWLRRVRRGLKFFGKKTRQRVNADSDFLVNIGLFMTLYDSLWLFMTLYRKSHFDLLTSNSRTSQNSSPFYHFYLCRTRALMTRQGAVHGFATISDPKLQKHSSVQISTKQIWRYLGPWAILSFRFSMIVALRPPGGGCFCRFRASLAFWGKTPSWIVDSGAWNSWNVQDGSLCPPPHASAWPVCNGKRRVSSAILVICHLEVWGRGPRTTRSARVSSHAYGALVVREGRFRRTRTAEMIADGRCYR